MAYRFGLGRHPLTYSGRSISGRLLLLPQTVSEPNRITPILSDRLFFEAGKSLAEAVNYSSSIGAELTVSEHWTVSSPINLPSDFMITCSPGAVIKNSQLHGGVLRFDNVTHSEVRNCKLVGSAGSAMQPRASSDGNVIAVTGGSSFISIEDNDISGHEFAGIFIDNASLLSNIAGSGWTGAENPREKANADGASS